MTARIPTDEESTKFYLKELKKIAKKWYGKPCEKYAPLCANCEVYRSLDTLNELMVGWTKEF